MDTCRICELPIETPTPHYIACHREHVTGMRLLRAKLFATGFAQVICVSANTVFIAHYQLIANVLTALTLSLMWTWNVKKVAFGDWTDRWMYASGAALGSVCGTVAANHAMRWLS